MSESTVNAPLLGDTQSDSGDGASYGATSTARDGPPMQDSQSGGHAETTPKSTEKTYKPFKELWILFVGLWTATFVSSMSITIVANNQLEIGTHFRASALASWLGTGFLIGLTSLAPLFGRLSDIIGRRSAMLLSLAVFIVGTLLCAIAGSMYILIFCRFIVGMGSGGCMTVAAIIISDLVSLRNRGVYQGIVSLMYGLGTAVGAAAGGAVTDLYGWRAAFWMQCPLPVVCALLVAWQIEPSSGKTEGTIWEKVKKIDWAGCFLLLINITALTVATSLFTTGGRAFVDPLVIGLYIVFGVTAILFYRVEQLAVKPILPPKILGQAQPLIILLAFTFQVAALTGRIYMQPIYLHIPRGLSGTKTGMVLVPSAIIGPFMSAYAGWHIRYFKEYIKLQFIMSAFSWIQAIDVCVSWGLDTSLSRIIVELAFGGLGMGMFTSLLISLFAVVGPEEQGTAVAASYVARAMGQVIGIGLSAPLQQVFLSKDLYKRLTGRVDDSIIQALIQEPLNVLSKLEVSIQIQARLAYMTSIRAVFGFTIVTGVLTTVLCLAIKAKKL